MTESFEKGMTIVGLLLCATLAGYLDQNFICGLATFIAVVVALNSKI